jgi:3-hydroxyisobutyrate dehydrogenase-like beta-hydroxyacid dehydrogenase
VAKHGISPEAALNAINESSGRSLQTQERVPKEVLTRQFNYGFPLGLMLKDVTIAVDSVCAAEVDGRDSIVCGKDKTVSIKLFSIVKNIL